MSTISFRVLDVETAQPIEGVEAVMTNSEDTSVTKVYPSNEGYCSATSGSGDFVKVLAPGYSSKAYSIARVPQTVRMLRTAVAVYLDRPSARPGEQVMVRVNAPDGCKVRVRRGHGSGGDDACFELAEVAPIVGHVPDTNVVADGLDWPGVSLKIPEARTGLWMVEVICGEDIAAAPLIIKRRDESASARILVLSSAATWLCYNHWGGRSRYRNNEDGPVSSKPSGWIARVRRAISQALSYIVPEVPRTRIKRALGVDTTQTSWISRRLSWRRPWGSYLGLAGNVEDVTLNHLAGLDRKILSWLDAEDIEYECASDLDLEFDPTLCDGRDAVVLLGHSEYWSATMFDRLHTAHINQGTWLLNLSGNSIYREVNVFDDFSVELSNIVMRLSGRDETELTGVRFSERAYGTASPYVVVRPDHWIFDGMRLHKGDRFGVRCLIANDGERADGYNPARPTTKTNRLAGQGAAGFEVDRLALKRRKAFALVAHGAARSSAHMVVKEPIGRCGGSFSASSINFGGSLLVDEVSSGVVRNVLRRASSKQS